MRARVARGAVSEQPQWNSKATLEREPVRQRVVVFASLGHQQRATGSARVALKSVRALAAS